MPEKFNYMNMGDYGYAPSKPLLPDTSSFLNGADFSGLAKSSAASYMNNNVTAGMGNNPGIFGGLKDMFSDSGFLKQTNADGSTTGGWGSAGLGVLQGLGSAYMGMKQFGMAKQQLEFQKDSFNKNYAAQRQSTNTGLEDRQNARVAAGGGAYQSVGDYMKQNRIA